ncbi:phage baseplate protein [Nostoc sp. LEGE 12447]|uniref:T4 family baseplate hub assembly chaperone n=1 Tax=Nostoc sp. LEGE 12447 TaxID=1828640 RepID=UPI001687CF66|nr:phage baseplate protein [Nostoc sp. LEGE 12447]MBD2511487.1 phage baseplate protein [Desmonostoc muscorum FACHB-395]MBE9001887.1 phage baseplate protein [Nostoc sp. LEGE 12447]
MRRLSSQELLTTWEQGLTQQPLQKALTLLTAACPDSQNLATLSIGQRDRLLFTLRELTFGSQVQSVAACPKCGEKLELNFQIADITAVAITPTTETFRLQVEGGELEVRLPNSLDLMAIATSSHQLSPTALLERCLLKTPASVQLSTDTMKAIAQAMAKADPLADIQLDLACPACDHHWHSHFDIVSFFWSEIHAWAIRTLREIHLLASAYSWREGDILAMSSYRRQLYLEMVRR